jgi:hypothetical protein
MIVQRRKPSLTQMAARVLLGTQYSKERVCPTLITTNKMNSENFKKWLNEN